MFTNLSYVNKSGALFGVSLIAASLLMLFVSSPARAVDFTVTNTNDLGEGSLREAVTAANSTQGANTIVFSPALASGTITLTSDQLQITDPDGVTIDGGSDITVRGGTSHGGLFNIRVFMVLDGGKLDLKNLTVNGGVAGLSGGGGVWNDEDSQLTVTNCTFSGNSAPLSSGGAILNGERGVVTVTNSTFSGNSASSTGTGGGILNNGGTLSVTDSTFSGNSAPQGGGGIFNNGTATLTDSTFSGNDNPNAPGGGIYNRGPLTLTNSTLSGNSAQQGGGIYNSGTLSVTNSPISGNSAQQGGGIYNGGTVTLTNSTLSGNKVEGAAGSTSKGGGIFNNGTGTLTASGSTFSGNSAGGPGGGVGGGVYSLGESTGANVTVANSTFWGNTATDSGGSGATGGTGGGIFSGSRANLTATNSTFAANSATIHGAAIESGPDSTFQTFLKNTIVADSTKVSNCDGSITDGGHNIDDGSSCGFSALTSKSNTDPKLDASGSYGGPTRTIALQDDSPAIDAIPDTNGSTAGCGDVGITTDQRGVKRPQDGDANGTASCDIGAFELPEPPPGQPVTTNEDTPKTITLTATDATGKSLTFAITQDPSHGTLGSIGAVTCTGTASKTCSANVTYTPAPNYYGFDSFKFRTNDGTVDSASAPVSLTVRSVNDAPSFQLRASRDQKVNEDAVAQSVSNFVSSFSTGPADESGQAVDYLVTNTNNSLFSAQPAISSSGTLTYTPAANANGEATVSVKIHDDGGIANGGVDESTAQSFNIAVNAVNDAPSFTKGADQTVDEDAPAQSIANWAANISVGPSNESTTQTVRFVVTDNSNPDLFSAIPEVSSNGTLTYTPAAKASGKATVSVKITDNGGTANGGVNESTAQSFTIAVNAVNDAPSEPGTPGLASGSTSPNRGSFTLNWAASTDVDNDPEDLTYTLQHKDADDAEWSNVATGLSANTFSFTDAAPDAEGTWTYRVRASDGSLNSAFSAASSPIIVDRTAPVVISTNPLQNAQNVPRNSQITATFKEDGSGIDPRTVDTTTFQLRLVKPSGSVPVSETTVTFVAATNTATLTLKPGTTLNSRAVYQATITTGVKDKAGNALAKNCVWVFTAKR